MPLLILSDKRNKHLQLKEPSFILQYGHRALDKIPELGLLLAYAILRNKLLPKSHQKIRPRYILLLKDSTNSKGPPVISSVPQSEDSQIHLILLRTMDKLENLLHLPNPILRNLRVTLSLKGRRSHSPEPLHQGSNATTNRICHHPLVLGLQSC